MTGGLAYPSPNTILGLIKSHPRNPHLHSYFYSHPTCSGERGGGRVLTSQSQNLKKLVFFSQFLHCAKKKKILLLSPSIIIIYFILFSFRIRVVNEHVEAMSALSMTTRTHNFSEYLLEIEICCATVPSHFTGSGRVFDE